MTDYLAAVMAMLGPPEHRFGDPAAWDRLHAELGVELPSDYRALVDAYAPVQLNGHLYLLHPATERWNLGEDIRQSVHAWSDVSWEGLDADEDPRQLFGFAEMRFGTPDGLWPIASTDRGEAIFFVDDGRPRFLVSFDETWEEYRMSFAEWLYRYLVGEDMTGPNSAAFYPGPVRLEHLPMSADDRTEPWYGPDRGM
ncbi:SMI1/KNR4 family protein [Streptomyces sp. NPDC057689]|uniref:SMI1/KNR4 family protein n=1 Tax=Streptomyces sp. NPDC057689 TaxID=3346213 RepID=UPI0036A20416